MKNHINLYKQTKICKNTMNKWLEILVGLILILLAVYVWMIDYRAMGEAALLFFKGGIVWFIIMIGLLFLMLGISDLRE